MVLGWLAKLVAALALVGVIGFDGIALVSTAFQAQDQANTAARRASEVFQITKDVQKAYNAAVASAATDGDTVEAPTFIADPVTGRITLRLHRTANTLWLKRVGPLKKYTAMTATGEATPF